MDSWGPHPGRWRRRAEAPCSNDSPKGECTLKGTPSPGTPPGDTVRESGCPLTAGIWVSLDKGALAEPLASSGDGLLKPALAGFPTKTPASERGARRGACTRRSLAVG